MKLIGMMILIASSTSIGALITINHKRKYELCVELISFANELLIDLEFKVTPINQLLDKTLKNRNLSFITLDNIVNKHSVNSILSKEENTLISNFLYSLGKSDVKTQIKLINAFILDVKRFENKYLLQYESNKKICISIGFFVGAISALAIA